MNIWWIFNVHEIPATKHALRVDNASVYRCSWEGKCARLLSLRFCLCAGTDSSWMMAVVARWHSRLHCTVFVCSTVEFVIAHSQPNTECAESVGLYVCYFVCTHSDENFACSCRECVIFRISNMNAKYIPNIPTYSIPFMFPRIIAEISRRHTNNRLPERYPQC